MRQRALDCDCVVVGGGLLGLLTADVAAECGHRVVLFCPPTGPGLPEADSQRNHAWFQSGLLYSDQMRAARMMASWGPRLTARYGLVPRGGRGVFRFDTEREASEFEQHARQLGLDGDIGRIADEAVLREELGALFAARGFYYSVPDRPFDEEVLMESVRARARARGVTLRRARVGLRRGSGDRVFIVTEDQVILAENTAICTGSAIPALAAELAWPVPLAVFRSALMCIGSDCLMKAPLFVDRSSGCSAVQHPRERVPPFGATVVGNRHRTRLERPTRGDRVVPKCEAEALLRYVGACASGLPVRFTAGFKTEYSDAAGRPSILPWTSRHPSLRGLTIGVPGKATLALCGAIRMVESFTPRSERNDAPSGAEWDDVIRMHHDFSYGPIDEALRPPR